MREDTLRERFNRQADSLRPKTRHLPPLEVGDGCRIQNQTGQFAKKWDRTGQVVQVAENDQYVVKVAGSGRLTLRNRKYLRKLEGQRTPQKPGSSLIEHRYDFEVKTPDSAREEPRQGDCGPEDIREEAVIEPDTSVEGVGQQPTLDSHTLSTPVEEMVIPTTSLQIPDQEPGSRTRQSSRMRNAPRWHKDYEIGSQQNNSVHH